MYNYLIYENNPLDAIAKPIERGTKTYSWRISMQVNCSINHTLNQSATNEELDMLVSLMERNYFRPNQQDVIAAFVGRQAIKNYLEESE